MKLSDMERFHLNVDIFKCIQFWRNVGKQIFYGTFVTNSIAMRIMAFDYGTKRTGIAVTDPLRMFAQSLTTVHPDQIWEFLDKYLLTESVEKFVVGQPKKLDGSASESAMHVKGFIRKLKERYPHVAVVEVDERFTSKLAANVISNSGKSKKKRQDKSLVDVVSATIILQDYLNSTSFG